jgi:hypothetical protein
MAKRFDDRLLAVDLLITMRSISLCAVSDPFATDPYTNAALILLE